MRLDHIHYRIDQQRSHVEFISHAYANLTKVGLENISRQRIETRLQALRDQWESFHINDTAIKIAMSRIEDKDQQVLRQRTYFREDLYTTTYECYLETIEKMALLLDNHRDSLTSLTSRPSSANCTAPSPIPFSANYISKLPRIDIPKFDGTLSEWLPFKDLFTSIVLSNPSASSIEKLQYLKTSLVGSAAEQLKNIPLTADNFIKAWDSLTSFYENKRILINSTLKLLFSMKKLTKESAKDLEGLYTSMNQIYQTLETLERPVRTWDDILVFIAVERLDPDSSRAWERHLGSSKDPPTWRQFNDFLITQIRSIQAFETSSGKPSVQARQPSVRAHFSGKQEQAREGQSCPLCSSHHFLSYCPNYTQKSSKERRDFVMSKGLCFNCLRPHRIAKCDSTRRCKRCGQRHHTSLHQSDFGTPKGEPLATTSASQSTTDSTPKQANHVHQVVSMPKSTILLATAQVKVMNEQGNTLSVRLLLDQGSEVSFVTEKLVQLLRIPRQSSSIPLVGIGAMKANKTKGSVLLTITPHFDPSRKIYFKAHILPKLTSMIPSVESTNMTWSHLMNLQLADPSFTTPRSIDIIIGADVYGQLLEGPIIKGPANSPTAQLTTLGWVISGPSHLQNTDSEVHTYHCSVDSELSNLLERFWHQEEIASSSSKTISLTDQECEEHFTATHTRDPTGRYIVRLPFKAPLHQLGNSQPTALRMLTNLQRKFESDPAYFRAYLAFLDEYKELQHMIQVPDGLNEPEPIFYLPHHGVIRESSFTTKLRVVFNGSCRVVSGLPLNEILHTGSKLQIELFDVLIWFRRFEYIFSSDIEKMYRQIKVHSDDWNFQRILWKEGERIIKYQLTTVTYGLACAPFLALRTILQLIRDEGNKFPLAVDILLKGRYVDDIFGGADTIEEAQQKALQVNQLCMAGGFPLKKWISNHPEVLKRIPSEDHMNTTCFPIKDNFVHALGLTWNPPTDTLHFQLETTHSATTTKRAVLSKIAQFFDPLGLLSPLFIKFKIFMQELWAIKLHWDDQLASPQLQTWQNMLRTIEGLDKIQIPRWVGTSSQSRIEIHGFCDASQLAMAATVYIRTISFNHKINVSLLCSKTKVAPLKRMTIPRLELSAAVMLTKLVVHCQQILDYQDTPCYLWTDSSIVYTWLNNHPSRWKDFIHNRVCFIQETIPRGLWKHISGKENPADCATRGLSAPELQDHALWWVGPPWLSDKQETWPTTCPSVIESPDSLEQRTIPNPMSLHVISTRTWDLLDRYSSWKRLLRITATCKRALQRFKRKSTSLLDVPLTPEELEEAVRFWTRHIQNQHFSSEIKLLSAKQDLPRSNPIIRLLPFVDDNGLLRVGGRLMRSSLDSTAKQPYILPRESVLSTLIIQHAHHQTLHGSTRDTLNYVRNSFWIIGGRVPVRSFILKCVRCTRYRRSQAQQLMGQLPASRVNPAPAFLHAGVDYAGPFNLKTWRGKTARTYKSWVALFICHATSAIHLETVTDYTADAFLAAYKRFTARRGICATLTSDCGTNLKGADRELRQLFSSTSSELKQFASLITNDGTKWLFNPPAAPHFGGIWEAGVKAMKYHLRRVVGETTLTYEEFSTLLTQIEAILNSRPLCPLTEDPEDLNVLTPGHFLIHRSLTVVPEPNLENLKTARLSRWQHLCQMTQSFWTKWSKEYLQRYQTIYKWNKSSSSITEGSVVLIMDERYPPAKWPLGRVIKTHPGPDNLIRVVTIRTAVNTITRPIVKLCLLLMPEDCSLPESTKAGGNV